MNRIFRTSLFCIFCKLVTLEDISTPQNTAEVKGNSVILSCGANSGSTISSWSFTATGSNRDVIIYSREAAITSNATSFNKVIDEDGFLNITSGSVRIEDAGIYKCNIVLKDGRGIRLVHNSAEIIVLDSDPQCVATNFTADGRRLKQLSCSVGYRGNWAPVMEWRQGGINGQVISDGVQNHITKDRVTSNFTLSNSVPNVEYMCRTFLKPEDNRNVTAENIPTYMYMYNYSWHDVLPNHTANDTGSHNIATNTSSDMEPKDKSNLVQIIIAGLVTIACLLLLMLTFISIRNCKLCRGDSVLMGREKLLHASQIIQVPKRLSLSRGHYEKQHVNNSSHDKLKRSYSGADGTEYAMMNNDYCHGIPKPITAAVRPTVHKETVYASIDHTLKAPPPPRYL